jgi:DNA polymerase-3 subunit epsilon
MKLNTLLKYFPDGLVAFDFETTGLSPFSDKIIEVAAVKLLHNKKVETYRSLINPEIDIPEITIAIHGITNEKVADAPKIIDVLPDFVEFLGDLPLLAHNAQFDMGFLVKEVFRLGIKLGDSNVYDSVHLSRSTFKNKQPAPEGFKLSQLANFFQVPLNHHQALDDSLACMRVFARCIDLIPAEKRNHFLRNRSLLFNTSSFKEVEAGDIDSKYDLLLERIPTQQKVYITYQGGTQGNEPRPIRPIGIIPMPQGLVLYAECLISKLHKNFTLRKIKKVIAEVEQ